MSYGMSLFTFASTLLLVHGHAAGFVPWTTHDGTPLRWVERQLRFHVATAEPEEVDLAGICAIYAAPQTPGGVEPEGPCCGSGDAAHGLATVLLFLGTLASRRRRAIRGVARLSHTSNQRIP